MCKEHAIPTVSSFYFINMNCNLALPMEIIEHIFSYCDCTTLKVLKRVDDDWKQLIDAVIKKRCLQNIPDLDLLEYKHKHKRDYKDPGDAIKLETICENWEHWQDTEKWIEFENVPFIYELKYISCVSVFDVYIAIGVDTGAVKIYNESGEFLKTYDGIIEREPQSIKFVPGVIFSQEPIALLVEYKDITGIHDFSQNYQPGVFEHQRVFSSYKQFICGVGLDGTVTIGAVTPNETNQQMSFIVLKLVQLHVPCTNNIFASLSQDKCMILSDDKVLLTHFTEEKDANYNIIGKIQEVASLDFEMSSVSVLWRDALIFYHKVIITNSQPRAETGQIFETFLLRSGITPSVKTVHLSEVFESLITCVFLYGNTLLLGFASGEVLFYEVHDWQTFDLKKYSKRITMHTKLGRIMSIDVVESSGKREFYVSGPTFVRKITGTSKTC